MSPDTPSPPDSASPDLSGQTPASFKVELDLEDAPFLEENAEPPPAPGKKAGDPRTAPAGEAGSAEKKASSALRARLTALLANKKRLALVGGVALFILLAPVGLMLFLSSGKKPPAPAAPTPEVITQPAAPPRQDAPPGPRFLFKAEPFMIALRGSEGQIRFLHCRFSIPTDNQALYGELNAKTIAVRDAIYY
jgi:flagellar FliL protein